MGRVGGGGDGPPGRDAMSELQLEDVATLCAIPRSPSGPLGVISHRCPSIVHLRSKPMHMFGLFFCFFFRVFYSVRGSSGTKSDCMLNFRIPRRCIYVTIQTLSLSLSHEYLVT